MKLHPDGTIEGSPQEILEYKRLQIPTVPKRAEGIQSPLMPNPLHPTVTCSGLQGIRAENENPTYGGVKLLSDNENPVI
ncbi:hypothetical protein D1872_249590 [compost metagenome]